jgi:hypothetical protein
MRFHSTPESVQNGEITKLAIIECFVSVAVYVGIAIHFKTLRYFAVAVAFAPLTLLRTDASIHWGLEMYRRAAKRFEGTLWSPLVIMLYAATVRPLLAISGLAIRIAATFYCSLLRPLETLQEVPHNWLRQALCTDFFYPPEVVPSEAAQDDLQTFKNNVGGMYLVVRDVLVHSGSKGLFRLLPVLIASIPFNVAAFLPPLFYRVSFKATSLVYYPFVWVAGLTVGSTESLKTRLERFTKGELEKTRRWVSGLVVTALAVKLGMSLGWIDMSEALSKIPFKKLVENFLVPHVWQWWQATLGLDALLTFFLLYYADAALTRLDTKDAWDSEAVTKTISSVSFLRASLAILTMSHFFWLAFTTTTGRYITF